MHIQWYPGHMTKSMRMIEENLPLVDAIIYVLDARAAYSCLNPKFDKLIANKKKVYVLNKSDLADPSATKLWQNCFESSGSSCTSIDGTKSSLTASIIKKLRFELSEKIAKQKIKGLNMPSRVMVLGIPNSGKSTIINSLCGSKRTKTGDKPGVTRGKQWVRIEDFEILDTPGTLWNAFADQTSARHLAYIGSINEDVLDTTQLAIELISELKKLYPKMLMQRYKIQDLSISSDIILEGICKSRGFLMKGGIDMDRAGKAVIEDFKKGRIGKISLERPTNNA